MAQQLSQKRELVVRNANKQFLQVTLAGIAVLLILLAIFGKQLIRFITEEPSAGPAAATQEPKQKPIIQDGFDPKVMEVIPPAQRAMQVAIERETQGDFMMEDGKPKEASIAYGGAILAAEVITKDEKKMEEASIKQAEEYIARFYFKKGIAHTGSKDFLDAFDSLKEAADLGYNYQEIDDDPRLRPLRLINNEKFTEVVEYAKEKQEETLKLQAEISNANARRAWRAVNR